MSRRNAPTKSRRKTTSRPYRLYIEYKGGCDDEIEDAVGRRCEGSGYSFVTGKRDLEFAFATKPSAEAAAKRAHKVTKMKAVVKKLDY